MMDFLKSKQRVFIFSLTVFFALALNVHGQEGEYKLKWTKNQSDSWEYNKKIHTKSYLHFEDAVYFGDRVPKYVKSFVLEGNSKIFHIENISYEPIPDSLLREVNLPDPLPDNGPRANVFSSGKDEFHLDISLLAVRKNPKSGKYERLSSFSITSEPQKINTKNLKSGLEVNNSLLGAGYWYKFKVASTGIYKLNYSDLIDLGISNPAHVRIYGYGGRQLSFWNGDPRPQDMAEIPIYMNKGSDGSFNSGDFILFYAEGPVTWDYDTTSALYRQKVHNYSQEIFYFITDFYGEGEKIPEHDNSSFISNTSVTEYDDYKCYEREWYNLVGSGREWYSQRVDIDDFDTTFSFPNVKSGNLIKIEAKMAGRSKGARKGHLFVNNKEVSSVTFSSANFSRSYNKYAFNEYLRHEMDAEGDDVNVGVSYDKVDQTDEAYLDYILLNARSDLKLSGKATFFRDIVSVGENNIAEFTVKNASSSTRIWNVTDINSVYAIKGNLSGDCYSFKAETDTLQQYVAVDLYGAFPKPIISSESRGVGVVENQNLRSLPVVDYIIVAPPVFKAQAERLANFHRYESKLEVEVIDPQHIFNEFSSGTPDITAMRDFFRHQYKRADSVNCFKYVLLFGDGSYNNHMVKEGNTNYILTYQSNESLNPTISYTSDDYFGMLEDNEGGEVEGMLMGKLNIGIGRIPTKVVQGGDSEAKGVVDKLLNYYNSDYSDWRRRLCFVGDDGFDPGGSRDDVTHMRNANDIATHIESLYTGFELKKVYLDAYPQVSSATGDSYPDVNRELQNLFERGILIFSYSGHGSENQITGEIILQKSDLESMKNKDVLPLFITATCQFSRFDHVDIEEDNDYSISPKTSAGEEGILNSDGGAVALLSTSRVVYSLNNTILVKNVFSHLFKENAEGRPYRLGEVIQLAKNQIGPEINKLNFTLLGDPAMVLNYPRYQVCTDSINGMSVEDGVDTLKAFGQVTVSGYVAYDDSTIIDNFNGFVYPHVYDKEIQIITFGNDNQPPFTYDDQKNLLYKGKATVTNGRFKFSFIVPKDISYNIDKGKISYYAENGVIDAKGEFRNVLVGGTDDSAEPDNFGPLVDLYMNNNLFVDGGITDKDPHIYAEVSDENGINTTGVGIGHDIVAMLDDEYNNPYVLNDYYQASTDDYTKGIVMYPLKDLEEGEHYLDLKVWDVFNNSSESSIRFLVISSDDMLLDKVYNYPNPAQYYTEFVYTHNAPDMEHEIVLEVFDMMGRLITRQEFTRFEGGYVSNPVHWDIRNSGGAEIGAGVYPYRLQVTTPMGTSFINQKLIIIR